MTTVKAGTQECGTECGTEIRCKVRRKKGTKCATMNVHAHIVKAHIVIGAHSYRRDRQVYSLAVSLQVQAQHLQPSLFVSLLV